MQEPTEGMEAVLSPLRPPLVMAIHPGLVAGSLKSVGTPPFLKPAGMWRLTTASRLQFQRPQRLPHSC